MTPNFHSPMSPNFPVQLKENHHDQHHQLFVFQSQSASSSSPAFFDRVHDQGGYYHTEQQSHHLLHHDQEEAKVYVSQGGSSCDHNQTLRNESDSGLKLTISKKEERNNENQSENSSVKWMSSKMRLMKKMMNPEGGPADKSNDRSRKFEDQKQFSSISETENSCNNNNNSYNINNNTTNTIRVCADCNTTKTPLWRSGPRGPKSLCNACGIRQRKARRAMAAAAAAAAANGTILAADAPPLTNKKSKVQHKDKATSNNKSCLPFKKRCKMGSPSPAKKNKNLGFEDLTIILSKNSAYQRVFPQDEKEAAILLMALSYGLVHG
ncbi:hypothetical protein ACOSP7_015185 [Xanthoceras sorbifolium]